MGLGESKTIISRPAAVDLKAKRWHFVTLAGAVPAAGALAFPLDNDDAAAGEGAAALVVGGVSPIYYGAAVAAGAPLTTDAAGKAVTAAAGDQIIGYALEAGGVGELGSVLVVPNGEAAA